VQSQPGQGTACCHFNSHSLHFRDAGTPTACPCPQAKTCDTIATTGANFKTAAFRLTVPLTLLARADGDRVMRFLLRCVSPQLCRFSVAGNDDLAGRSDGRRPKSAKARNRTTNRQEVVKKVAPMVSRQVHAILPPVDCSAMSGAAETR
jgi:hypothetical protein